VGLPLGTPPHDLVGFVNLETGLLQVLHDPLGELLAGIVRDVILEEPAQEIATAGDREADREGELGTERAVIHGGMFLFCSRQRSPGAVRLSRCAGIV
jgi:hypothetical protein